MQETVKLDIKDRKIIRELDMNANMNIKKLAKKVGLSRQTVLYRIERMKKDGILLGAITVFDSAVIGQRWFRVCVQLNKISPANRIEFNAYFKKHPNAFWIGEVGGNWDFVLNFVTEDQFSFNQLFEKMLEDWGAFIRKYEILAYINVRDQARQYTLPTYETEKTEFFHEMKINKEIKLDELDKKIISIIAKDAWISATAIGTKLEVNYKTVQQRIKNLEKNKVIVGYRLVIHPRKLGYEQYIVFLDMQSYNAEIEKKLYGFLNNPNVTFVVKHIGIWKIGIEIEVSSGKEFQDFLVELRTRFSETISNYETFPIFEDHLMNYFPDGALK